jgi:hypothetical protein
MQHALKACCGVELKLQAVLSTTLDGGDLVLLKLFLH